MPDLTNKEKVDRLLILVSGAGVEQLLGVPKIDSGTGRAQADAVKRCLEDWELCSKIKGMSFNTTASNSGEHAGACTLLQAALGHDVLHLACRHHIFEIVAEKAFTAKKIAPSSGPDIAIFRRFQEKWPFIDQSNFETAVDSVEIISFKDRIIDFAKTNLQMFQPRDDFKELLELVIIFLGGTPSRGVHFQAPGALHRARWMARIIYSFKMWMFKSQFKLKAAEEDGLLKFILFISEVYIQAWFEAPSSVSAPANDLRFVNQLTEYRDSDICKATADAFKRHLWYLSEVTVGLAFFDPKISIEEKNEMITMMNKQAGSEIPRPRLDVKHVNLNKPLSSFITTSTRAFFTILNLNDAFLSKPPESWKDDENYIASEQIVTGLKVVNDSAERGVKLMQDYNSILTNDENQKQFLLQIVQQHRRTFPDSTKRTIVAGMKTSAADDSD